MDKEKKDILIEYRKNHPNCEYCIWFEYNSPFTKLGIECPDYLSCELKDAIIHFPKIKAKFCKNYKVEERNKNEI